MSQFDSTFAAPDGASSSEPKKTSGMAVTALVFSLIFCCPITTVLGVLLGLIALVTMGDKKKGKGIAIAAVIIGIITTAISGYAAIKIGKLVAESAAFVQEGPAEAMNAASANDVAAFKAAFYGAGSTATDAEAQAFIDAVNQRYGTFQSAMMSQQSQPPFGQPVVAFPYTLTFSNATVESSVELTFADEATGEFVMKVSSITIIDPDSGDLTFP